MQRKRQGCLTDVVSGAHPLGRKEPEGVSCGPFHRPLPSTDCSGAAQLAPESRQDSLIGECIADHAAA